MIVRFIRSSLAVGPGVVRFGEPVLNAVCLADHIEAHRPGVDGVAVPGLLGELDSIVGQDRVDAVGHSFQQVLKKLPCRSPVSLFDKLRDRKLAGAVDGYEQGEFAFGGLLPKAMSMWKKPIG